MAFIWYGPLALVVALSAVDAPRPLSEPPPATSAARPPATLLVRVVDEVTRRVLPNAEVTAAPVWRLTDAEGNARFLWPDDGTLSIRVRQIGFRYADRTIRRGTSTTATEDTVVVALARAAFALPQVVTRADGRCDESPDSATLALSASSMELLRFGAEQYDNFRATYPFNVTLARRTVRNPPPIGMARVDEQFERTGSGAYGDVYAPAHVLQRTRGGYFIPLLFVSTLADSVFWSRHCFAARGVETLDGRRVIRLDFSPARGIREVEWEGSAWLDSAASVLRRVDFRLANLRDPRAPRGFSGYTIFAMPSPNIAVPDSTVAWWWNRRRPSPDDDERSAEVLQALTVRATEYLRGVPP
ncbi:MAG: hypothetical protein JWL95_2841 [Gemmatimonadetes bacterium]|nr:hypothetical protein [Gemmatimonadota bacterium]